MARIVCVWFAAIALSSAFHVSGMLDAPWAFRVVAVILTVDAVGAAGSIAIARYVGFARRSDVVPGAVTAIILMTGLDVFLDLAMSCQLDPIGNCP